MRSRVASKNEPGVWHELIATAERSKQGEEKENERERGRVDRGGTFWQYTSKARSVRFSLHPTAASVASRSCARTSGGHETPVRVSRSSARDTGPRISYPVSERPPLLLITYLSSSIPIEIVDRG